MAIENIDKTVLIEVVKMPNTINFDNKFCYAISNSDIDVAKNPGLTGIKNTRDALVKFKTK